MQVIFTKFPCIGNITVLYYWEQWITSISPRLALSRDLTSLHPCTCFTLSSIASHTTPISIFRLSASPSLFHLFSQSKRIVSQNRNTTDRIVYIPSAELSSYISMVIDKTAANIRPFSISNCKTFTGTFNINTCTWLAGGVVLFELVMVLLQNHLITSWKLIFFLL